MSEALKPCAHCGETRINIHKVDDCEYCTYLPSIRFEVVCSGCCLTIVRATEEEAIAAWNLRASPSWSTEPPRDTRQNWI